MARHPRPLTADDVFDMPVPDGLLGYELVDGRPVPVTPASWLHGRLILRVASALDRHLRERHVGGEVSTDAGFVLGLAGDPERTRAPDVSYLSEARIETLQDPERFVRGVPDLAVEIDLTSGKKPGGRQRILDYLDAGVPLVWAIDPQSRTATVYRPDGSARLVREGEALDGEDVLPGFRLPLQELFG